MYLGEDRATIRAARREARAVRIAPPTTGDVLSTRRAEREAMRAERNAALDLQRLQRREALQAGGDTTSVSPSPGSAVVTPAAPSLPGSGTESGGGSAESAGGSSTVNVAAPAASSSLLPLLAIGAAMFLL